MRLFSFIIVLISLGNLGQAQKTNCIINAKSNDAETGVIYLQNMISNSIDTLQLKDFKFSKSLALTEPTPLVIADDQRHYQIFFGEPNSTIKIEFNRNQMQVTALSGSKSHEVFRKLIVSQEPYQQAAQQIQQYASTHSGLNGDSINQIMSVINTELRKNFNGFLTENATSEVAAFVLHSAVSNDRNLNVWSADTMAKMLKGKAKTSHFGLELDKTLNKLRAVSVGFMAPDFTLPDSTGKKKYTLSSLRGKYVLIDFWASWCGPCKGEIPFLKEAYAKFNKKGFEIMSVSLDSKEDAWKNALKQFQMPWIHVSDIKGFGSAVNELYHVPSIPKTLLLDKTGKIIATDLRGNALDLKLEELLGSK
jgi:peroxiredoxin